jgi:hypothetical protein
MFYWVSAPFSLPAGILEFSPLLGTRGIEDHAYLVRSFHKVYELNPCKRDTTAAFLRETTLV